MANEELSIGPATKVADLLDAYPQLEDVLVRMAPPFRKLRNPLLRRSIARIASLRQAAVAGRLDLAEMIDSLREVVGQPPLAEHVTVAESDYLGTAPDWFEPGSVVVEIDDRDAAGDEMAIARVLRALKQLEARQVVRLSTAFVPAPGIDAARAKGLVTWTVREADDLYRTHFAK